MSAGLAGEPVNPVVDLDDEDHKPPALNQVDHAIVADAQPIEPASIFLAICR